MGRREYAVIVAGLIILSLVIFRENQIDQWRKNPPQSIVPRRLAPKFQLADHRRNIVKLEGLLGRHQIVLIFFDGESGVDGDPRTKSVIENFPALSASGIKILAVSTATPYANEQAEERLGQPIPFSVLTDVDFSNLAPRPLPAHTAWGKVSETGEPESGVFLIGRDGTVAFGDNGFPIAVADENSVLKQLSQGVWPTVN
ncbi:redoxin domain-containing protein [Thalassoglobus sp. JC818]|uniref:redoxin domain-containing protein n=1 Tax=Thalassoglobus sp. JC818 TaxID=3232136 RepID=UPI0034587DCE